VLVGLLQHYHFLMQLANDHVLLIVSMFSSANRMIGRQAGTNGVNVGIITNNQLAHSTLQPNRNVLPYSTLDNAVVNGLSNPPTRISPVNQLHPSLPSSVRASETLAVSRACHNAYNLQESGCHSCPTMQVTSDTSGGFMQSQLANGIVSVVPRSDVHCTSNGSKFASSSLPKSFTRSLITGERETPKQAAVHDLTSNSDMARSLTMENAVPCMSTSLGRCHVNSLSDHSSSSSFDM
jgi:hypothetical protein